LIVSLRIRVRFPPDARSSVTSITQLRLTAAAVP
jgi:hypothetical protein